MMELCVRHVIPGSLASSHSGRMNVVLLAMVDMIDKMGLEMRRKQTYIFASYTALLLRLRTAPNDSLGCNSGGGEKAPPFSNLTTVAEISGVLDESSLL
jgi:hypothetical protein